jgi:hypothetical protein
LQLEREYLSLFSSVYDRELQELVGGSTGARTHLLALQHAEHYEVRPRHTDLSSYWRIGSREEQRHGFILPFHLPC